MEFYIKQNWRRVIVILAMAGLIFGLGYLSGRDNSRSPIIIEKYSPD